MGINTTDNIAAQEILMHSEWSANLKTLEADKIILQLDKTFIPLLINYLVQHNVGILSAEPRHSLEDYFLSLTTSEIYVEPAAI